MLRSTRSLPLHTSGSAYFRTTTGSSKMFPTTVTGVSRGLGASSGLEMSMMRRATAAVGRRDMSSLSRAGITGGSAVFLARTRQGPNTRSLSTLQTLSSPSSSFSSSVTFSRPYSTRPLSSVPLSSIAQQALRQRRHLSTEERTSSSSADAPSSVGYPSSSNSHTPSTSSSPSASSSSSSSSSPTPPQTSSSSPASASSSPSSPSHTTSASTTTSAPSSSSSPTSTASSTPAPSPNASTKEIAAVPAAGSKEVAKAEKKKKDADLPLAKRAWKKVKEEAAHYWAGTKLLGKEIRISTGLQWKVLQGGTLTRRERRQLRRTTGDLLRLIPFSVFIVVPFMEFLLPVALKLFPNMLPSTFEGQFAKDEKERKLLRVRIEMAKFLQETVKESGLKMESVVKSDEFKEFFRKVRSTGQQPSATDIVRVAKLFNDDITLDNLSRAQLVSMCRYMNINAWGTDNFLKHQIRNKLEKVRVDDMMISAEGVDSLSTKELQSACQSRGIRFQGVSPAHLREELEQWIDLHYTNGISGVLLILSRAFNFGQKEDDIMGSLVTTLSSLPENLINEAELNVSDESSYKQKLEVLEQQQELIEDEAEQEQEEQEARARDKQTKRSASASEEEAEPSDRPETSESAQPGPAGEVAANLAASTTAGAASSEPATSTSPSSSTPSSTESESSDDARMTKAQLSELAEALSILTAKSSIEKERDELKSLLEDNLLSEAEQKALPDSNPVVAVSKRVRGMINRIEAQLVKYDERVGSSLNLINTNAKGQISLEDLKRAMGVIAHKPPQEAIEGLGKKLDVDQDGFVELDHVVSLTQDHGLGIVLDDTEAQKLLDKGQQMRKSPEVKEVKDTKPKREDIVSDD